MAVSDTRWHSINISLMKDKPENKKKKKKSSLNSEGVEYYDVLNSNTFYIPETFKDMMWPMPSRSSQLRG